MLLAIDAGNTKVAFASKPGGPGIPTRWRIATGGLATLFDRHTSMFDAIEPDLTITGLAMILSRPKENA